MWLYVPCQFAPVKPDSNSACTSAESNWPLSATWNGKPMRRQTLPALLKRVSFLKRLSGLTCEPSAMQASALSWKASNLTCSRADTPASRSVSRADSTVRMILGTFGRRLLRRLARIGRASVFSRMSQPTLDLGIPKCEPTFEQWATELRRDCSRRASSAAAIVGSGCLSWRWMTPQTADTAKAQAGRFKGDHNRDASLAGNYRIDLKDQAAMWPTASTCERGAQNKESKATRPDTGGIDLQTVAQQWQTPAGQNFISRKQVAAMEREPLLPQQARQWPTPHGMVGVDRHGHRAAGGEFAKVACRFSHPAPANSTDGQESSPSGPTSPPRLNPVFVGWLMGFPCDWTHIEATGSGYMATQLSRWSRRMRGYFCGLICSMAPEVTDD